MMKHASLAVSKRYISSSHNSVSEIPPFSPLNISDYLTDTTSTSLSSALQYYISSNNPSQGQKIHSHIIKSGFKPNTNISIKILVLFLKSNCLNYARKVFDEMPQPTLSAYNYMLNGYVKDGQVKELVGLVQKMVLSSEKPDGFTLSMILKSLRCSGEIHAKIFRLDVEADDVLYTALVDSYVRNGRIGYARRVFDTMVEKNVICSTSMISGYMNIGNFKEAEDVFRRTCKKDTVVFNAMIEGYSKSIDMAKKSLEVYIDMQRCGYRPTISTFSSIIGACSILSAFEIGQQVQCQLTKTVWFMDIKMGSALVDMYSKCGRIEDAPAGKWERVEELRESMKDKGISKNTGFSWVGTDTGLEGFHITPDADVREGISRLHIWDIPNVKPWGLLSLSERKQRKRAEFSSHGYEVGKTENFRGNRAICCCCCDDECCECRPLGFLLGLTFAFLSLLLSFVGVILWIVGLVSTCICSCCLCATIVVESALGLIKAPILVMKWFTSKIRC
ncbi:Pentatricopeptide repeat [Dillenia turbinata]|uniref:Pentatricopeptide repeat n=1 Tax=Dillenia turbinata TaxID=194707 RepID=A0AAN8ZFH4_9MAGN